MNSSELLLIVNLNLTIGDRQILKNINLKAYKGELINLAGKIGAGKSTLAQVICGLIKQTSGTIKFKEVNILKIKPDIFYRDVSLVFQVPERQVFRETVYDEISFGLKNLGFSDKEIENRIDYYTRLLDLDSSLLERPPLFLSGGELRKVALISSLVVEPKLLILDEPFAWLDDSAASKLRTIIYSLKEQGSTIILIGHGTPYLKELCPRFWYMDDGKVVYDGESADYLKFREHKW